MASRSFISVPKAPFFPHGFPLSYDSYSSPLLFLGHPASVPRARSTPVEHLGEQCGDVTVSCTLTHGCEVSSAWTLPNTIAETRNVYPPIACSVFTGTSHITCDLGRFLLDMESQHWLQGSYRSLLSISVTEMLDLFLWLFLLYCLGSCACCYQQGSVTYREHQPMSLLSSWPSRLIQGTARALLAV